MYKSNRFVDYNSYNAWLNAVQQDSIITITNIITMNTYFIVTYFEEDKIEEETPIA